MKTNSKLYLSHNKELYQSYINMISDRAQIYIDASKELLKLDVKGYKAENLINGEFVEKYHNYHKAKFKESTAVQDAGWTYDFFLKGKGHDLSRLKELEQKHNAYKNHSYVLYDVNDALFSYAKYKTTQAEFSKIMDLAPKKREYKLFDFLKFKGDKPIINVPKEPFNIYAFNSNQIDLLQDVTDFVNAARKLDVEYREVKSVVGKYLKYKDGLSYDLKTINFDYTKVLAQRI